MSSLAGEVYNEQGKKKSAPSASGARNDKTGKIDMVQGNSDYNENILCRASRATVITVTH